MSKPVIAIVGAGPGVGLAVARRFAREGFCAALIARRPETLKEYTAEFKNAGYEAHGFAADAADEQSIRQAFAAIKDKLGAPSVLVYNAAIMKMVQPSQLHVEDLIHEFRVNVAGALVSAQCVLEDMKAAGAGTILLTGGGFALSPMPAFTSLAIGKASIRNLTSSLAGELEPLGIHVGTVTICGIVKAGTQFDPDKIAEAYYTLHSQEPGKREREIIYR
jgi:short-subunit dehydrogenase